MTALTRELRKRLREVAFNTRERIRHERDEEGYPATVDEVDELVELVLDKILPAPDAGRCARDYLWAMCAPSSVREEPGAAEAERTSIEVPPGYEALADALDAALQQSAEGKGRERHANERPFEHQPIMEITREQGLGFPMGQARKKVSEAAGMLRRQEPASARAELLGAIVYLAAAVLAIEEGMR